MSEWKALQGRLTFFTAAAPSGASALTLYKTAWGADPLSFQSAPHNPLANSTAQGTYGGLSVACLVQPGRVDFVWSPQSSDDPLAAPTFALIEDGSALRKEMQRLISVAKDDLVKVPVVRVATYLVVVSVQPSVVAANHVVSSVIMPKYKIALTDEEEFVLQINANRLSRSIVGLKLNRICKWSVDRYQLLTLNVAASSPTSTVVIAPTQKAEPKIVETIAATVAFDNNNVARPADQPLAPKQQNYLLDEMFSDTITVMKEIGLKLKGFENG